MPTYTGTIRHNDLEGGFFELVADDGTVYRLEGTVSIDAGTRVRVDGEEEAGGFGIHMTGTPALKVRKIEKV